MKKPLSLLLALCVVALSLPAPAEEETELLLTESADIGDTGVDIEPESTAVVSIVQSNGVLRAEYTVSGTLRWQTMSTELYDSLDESSREAAWTDLSASGDTLTLTNAQPGVYRCVLLAGDDILVSEPVRAAGSEPDPEPDTTAAPEDEPTGAEPIPRIFADPIDTASVPSLAPEAEPIPSLMPETEPDAEGSELLLEDEPAPDASETPTPRRLRGFTYTPTSDTECTVTGCTETATAIEIPAELDGYTVTAIGDYAFDSATFTSVTLPDTLTSIGEGAFGFSALTSVVVPAGVSGMGSYAFGSCASLASVTLSGSCAVGMGAFYGCAALERVTFSSQTAIGDYAFNGCTALKALTLPDTLRTIGECAFSGSGLTAIALPDSVTTLKGYAFMSCTSLNEASVGSGITDLPNGTFYCCTALSSVSLPVGLKQIGISAFMECLSLKQLALPSGLTALGSFAFCDSALTSASLPAGITAIPQSCFMNCAQLETVECAGSLTEIGEQAFYIGSTYDSTAGTYSADADTVLRSVTVTGSIGSIGSNAFTGCTALKTLTSGSGGTALGYHALYGCTSLSTLTLPGGITALDTASLRGCRSLKSVALNAALFDIPDYAFRDCVSLTSIALPEGLNSIGYAAFTGCTALESLSVNGLVSLGETAFYGCKGLRSVSLTNGPAKIPQGAFYNCSSLATLELSGTRTIDSLAFRGCSQLTVVRIPAGTTEIGSRAFVACTSLRYAYVPASVTYIGSEAFPTSAALVCAAGSTAAKWAAANGLRIISNEHRVTSVDSNVAENAVVSLRVGARLRTITGSAVLEDGSAGRVTFECSDPSVATVDAATGAITALKAGTTTVTISAASPVNEVSRSFTVRVVAASRDLPARLLVSGRSVGGVGEQFELSVTDDRSLGEAYTLTSSNPAVLRIDGHTATLLKAGTATVTARSFGTAYGTLRVTVKAAPTSVTLSRSSVALAQGDACTLSAALTRNSAATLTYTSSDPAVAAVDASGRIIAVGEGTASIVAVAHNGVASAPCVVTVAPALKRIVLSESVLTLGKGESRQLTCTTEPCVSVDTVLHYASSDTSVVRVTAAGKLTAAAPGSCTVTVTGYNGVCAELPVTVTAAPTRVTVVADRTLLGIGETADVSATLNAGAAGAITFTSSSPRYATVDSTGHVTALKAGTVTITARAYNGRCAAVRITIKAQPTSVGLSPATLSVGAGDTAALTATLSARSASLLTWESSAPDVCTVADAGAITAVAPGTAVLTVRTSNGLSATCTVTVRPAPTELLVSGATRAESGWTLSLARYRKATLKVTAPSLDALHYTLTSSDPTGLAVSGSTLTAKRAGSYTVTAQAYNGVQTTILVTVK